MFPIAGVQGIQGATGPAGPTFAQTTVAIAANPSISGTTTLVIFASSAAAGTLRWSGNIVIRGGSTADIIVTATVGGSDITTMLSRMTTTLDEHVTIPISGAAAIALTNAFAFKIVVSASTAVILAGNITYSIQ